MQNADFVSKVLVNSLDDPRSGPASRELSHPKRCILRQAAQFRSLRTTLNALNLCTLLPAAHTNLLAAIPPLPLSIRVQRARIEFEVNKAESHDSRLLCFDTKPEERYVQGEAYRRLPQLNPQAVAPKKRLQNFGPSSLGSKRRKTGASLPEVESTAFVDSPPLKTARVEKRPSLVFLEHGSAALASPARRPQSRPT